MEEQIMKLQGYLHNTKLWAKKAKREVFGL
jgi:hypothetical protein